MKLIALTLPCFFEGEAEAIRLLIEDGLELLHLRKPGGKDNQFRQLLSSLPEECRTRMVLHDAFPLAGEYGLRGIHVNSRNNRVPENHKGTVSRSCHSPEEVRQAANFDYVFLSPIFNSISKQGYGSGFTAEELQQAAAAGIISRKVIALGGMDSGTIPQIAGLGFGGVAVLGALWGDYPSAPDAARLLSRFRLLKHTLTRSGI